MIRGQGGVDYASGRLMSSRPTSMPRTSGKLTKSWLSLAAVPVQQAVKRSRSKQGQTVLWSSAGRREVSCIVPTTSPRMVTALLDALENTLVPYAVLHREADAAAGVIESDIDVVLGRPACEVIPALVAALSGIDAGLAMIWPYDTNSLTTFWLSRDCRSGVQLDLVCDPNGRGRYGLRTEGALRCTERGERWMRLKPEVEQTYLVAKRWSKSDTVRLREIVNGNGANHSVKLAEELLSPRALRAVSAAYAGQSPPRFENFRQALRKLLSRRARLRLCHPVGVLVRLRGEGALTTAQQVCKLLDRVVLAAYLTAGQSPLARAQRFVRLRRPHVLVCVEDVATCPDIDVTVPCRSDLDDVLDAVWHGLVDNAARRLREWTNVGRW
jgi:hypothetical protein